MLLVEMGFFQGDSRKAVGRPTHGKMRCSGKICWSRNKGLFPGIWHLLHDQVVQHCLAVKKPSLVFTKSRRSTKVQTFRAISSDHAKAKAS